MNFHGAYSNSSLLIALTSAIVIDGVLTAVVLHQHHDQTANGQVSVRAAPTVSVPLGVNIVASPHAVAHPGPATTPDPVDTSVGSAAPGLGSAAPRIATTSTTPVLVGSAPRTVTPSQQAPDAHTPFTSKTWPHRPVTRLPASPPPAVAVPVPATPQTSPATPAKPAKPGAPPGF